MDTQRSDLPITADEPEAVAREILRRMGYPDPGPQPESAHASGKAPAARDGLRR